MASLDPNLAARLAHLPSVRAAVAAELRTRAQRVEAVVAAHTRTGALASSLQVVVDRVDSTVSISDPAILAINYGHRAPDGRWVEGIHAIEAGL
ncbi:DUF5403 family protein [Kitasatospora cheerisanensis]|uniref:Uncharacterized protein n=1 Tax=Kitasatospora cheerisanensis KCTC 2395 TaxID=1348663 RepID=A0A066YS42_9ACTN|nr:DUF5403 family protein [Kitasatospora cheerisanensis]KDN84378.1 hypothetical protein KCH_41690 [Kitasatospora cheerisanensis KCTC 2395]